VGFNVPASAIFFISKKFPKETQHPTENLVEGTMLPSIAITAAGSSKINLGKK